MDLAITRDEETDGENPLAGDARINAAGDFVRLADDSVESERQCLEVALATFLAEWFVDVSQGVPWREVLGEKGARSAIEGRIEAMVRAEVLRRGTVSEIASVEVALDPVTRVASVTFYATLKSGEDIAVTVKV